MMAKTALLAFALLSSLVVRAQTTPERRIPFVFLNQYFSYDLVDADKIILSDKTINFNDIAIDKMKRVTTINLDDLAKLNFSNYTLTFRNEKQEVVGQKPFTPAEMIGSKTFSLAPTATDVCILSSNLFTKFQMCKSLAPSTQVVGARIDDQPIENRSIVVLKSNEKPITFEATLSNTNNVKLTTKKRIFYPKSIQKEASQPILKIRFIDSGLTTDNVWDDNINVNQSTLTIPKDSILKLKQDLYFVNTNVQNMAVNYAAPVPAPKREVVKSKAPLIKPDVYIEPNEQYILEPFTIFTGMKGKNSTLDASLASDLGKGLKFSYRKKMDDVSELQTSFTAYQIGITNDVNQATIGNASQMLFIATAGWKYSLTSSLGIIPQVEFQQDLFFKNTLGTSEVSMVAGLNKQLSVNPYWIFYSGKHAQASLDLGLTYILPTSAGGLSVKSGNKVKYGASFQYRLPSGAVLLQFQTGIRKQDFDDIVFSENFIIMSAGYSFYFQ